MAIQKRTYIDFLGQPEPFCQLTNASTGTGIAATGDTSVNQWTFSNGAQLEYRQELASADILPVKTAGVGLVIPNDNVNQEGGEIIVSDSVNSTGPCFTVGTDAAFRFDLKVKVPVVADYDIIAAGFRKQAAMVNDLNDDPELITLYDDIACLNINEGTIDTCMRLDSGTGVDTPTTDTVANDATVTLTTLVSAAGVATFLIDGAAPTVNTNTMTFSDGEVLIPFFAYCKDDTAGADTPPILVSWFSGHQ